MTFVRQAGNFAGQAGFLALMCSLALLPRGSAAQTVLDQTVDSATTVLDEIMSEPGKQIPQALFSQASAVAVIPNVVKGGFVVGVRRGRGVVSVRDDAGNWQPPVFATLTGGSVGWQAGLQSTDVVLVFRTRRSVNGLMNGKLTIGADAAAAAGPVGRQVAAATDARLAAEILSYSRSRGLFAGVSIDGSVLQIDHFSGNAYYNSRFVGVPGQAVRTVPASAARLLNRLAHYSGAPRNSPPAELAGVPATSTAPTTAPSELELVRRQLIDSWLLLSPLLDDRWKAYLAPPRELLSGESDDAASLRGTLQRYDLVTADDRYRSLNRRTEFATVRRLLRQYVSLPAARPDSQLTLPPPPASTR